MGTLILLIIGIILVLVNYRSLKKENGSNFEATLSKAAKRTNDYDLELIKLRKEFAETILELQNETEGLKDRFNNDAEHKEEVKINDYTEQITNEDFYDEDINDELETLDEDEDNSEISQQSNNVKVKEIEKLLQEGLSIDLICEKLDGRAADKS
jgi:oligoribonuclease NrnB/cAMP/cGMP phosphodiesterase (DHH superfamily)